MNRAATTASGTDRVLATALGGALERHPE